MKNYLIFYKRLSGIYWKYNVTLARYLSYPELREQFFTQLDDGRW